MDIATMCVKELFNYGVLGLAVIGLCVYIYLLHKKSIRSEKSHREERKEWRSESKDQYNVLVNTSKENMSIVSGLKTIMESVERRL